MRLFYFSFLSLLLATYHPSVGQTRHSTSGQKEFIEIVPRQLDLSGTITSSPFQAGFTIFAKSGDVVDLSFGLTNLRETSKGRAWLSQENIKITPVVTSIKSGESQDFVVSLNDISQVGIYVGSIKIFYKGQASDSKQQIPLSLRVAKLSSVPPQVLVYFEKCLICAMSSNAPDVTLSLTDDKAPLSPEMIAILEGQISTTLTALVNADDVSQVVSPELSALSNQELSNKESVGTVDRGLVLKYRFRNMDASAGKYLGSLILSSKNMGPLANVPVELRIRYPQWLAWVLLWMGVAASLGISRWNTMGKRKNVIQGKAFELARKLKLDRDPDPGLQKMFDELEQQLGQNELDKAEQTIIGIDELFAKYLKTKSALNASAAEARTLIGQLESLRAHLKTVPSDSEIMKNYLPSIATSLKTLSERIEQNQYANNSELVDRELADPKRQVSDVKSVLDDLSQLERQITRLENEYRSAFPSRFESFRAKLEEKYALTIKTDLGNCQTENDLLQVKIDVEEAKQDCILAIGIIRDLSSFQRVATRLRERQMDVTSVESAIAKCCEYIELVEISLAEAAIEQIKEAVKQIPASEIDRKTTSQVERLLRLSVLDQGIVPKDDDVAIAGKNLALSSFWHSVSFKWLTPKQKGKMVNSLLWIVLVMTLTVLGFSQLYASNPIFGAKNPWLEYLALFLWGFGIQTGASTVSDVIKSFQEPR